MKNKKWSLYAARQLVECWSGGTALLGETLCVMRGGQQ
jgi:hypothetical protein